MRVPLTGGFYQQKSLIAGAQRCVNLYPETNQGEDSPTTHYLTPGLTVLLQAALGTARCLYRASNGALYACVKDIVYLIATDWTSTVVGTITAGSTLVSMSDNSLALVIVDGTSTGYCLDLATQEFAEIWGDGAFYGADRVDYVDTYFVFNRPATNEWYIAISEVSFLMLTGGPVVDGTIVGGAGYVDGAYTGVFLTDGTGSGCEVDITIAGGTVTAVDIVDGGQSYRVGDVLSADPADTGGPGSGFAYTVTTIGSSAFDPLDIAAKTGGADPIQTLIVMHREVWLLGTLTSEVWYNTGASDFTFGAVPGVFVEHGCAAKYSVAKADLSIFWLGQDIQGKCIVFEGNQYTAKRISTHAIENEISSYGDVTDAVGFTYQQEGHVFYQLTFPSADRTWTFDLATQLWHERTWTDDNGDEHRSRANCAAFFNGVNVVGDQSNGLIYQYDPKAYTDNGRPISRRRGFPHIMDDGARIFYRQFIADMAVGEDPGTLTDDESLVSLRWSDTRGASWGNPVTIGFGSAGEYLRSAQFQRLGMARDRVFELFWSAPVKTALNGAFIDYSRVKT